MRVLAYARVGALTLAAADVTAADDMSNMKGMAKTGASAAKHGKGAGVIKALDLRNGSLTIQHGPIPDVSWPACCRSCLAMGPVRKS